MMKFNHAAYEIISSSGRGAYGEVFVARSRLDDNLVALKVVTGCEAKRELSALMAYRSCRHPNLMPIFHVESLPEDGFFYTTLLADNVSQTDYRPDTLSHRLALGKLPVRQIEALADSLANALNALHKRGLIHRDVKPDNVLFVNGEAILGDPGLATFETDASLIGTPSFMPIEVLQGKRPPAREDDFYALSLTLYCALTGLAPHDFPQKLSAAKSISRRILVWNGITPSTKKSRFSLLKIAETLAMFAYSIFGFSRILQSCRQTELVEAKPTTTTKDTLAARPESPRTPPKVAPVPATAVESPEQRAAYMMLEQSPDESIALPELSQPHVFALSADEYDAFGTLMFLDSESFHLLTSMDTESFHSEIPLEQRNELLAILSETPLFYTHTQYASAAPKSWEAPSEKFKNQVYRFMMQATLNEFFRTYANTGMEENLTRQHGRKYIYTTLLLWINIALEAQRYLDAASKLEQQASLQKIAKLGDLQLEVIQKWRKGKENYLESVRK